MRTKVCRLIGRATCLDVLPITIDFKTPALSVGVLEIVGIDELDKFARRDGFNAWGQPSGFNFPTSFTEFWRQEHGQKIAPGYARQLPNRWSGIIIYWTDLRPVIIGAWTDFSRTTIEKKPT